MDTINSGLIKVATALGVSDFSGCETAVDYLGKIAEHYGVTIFNFNTIAEALAAIAGGSLLKSLAIVIDNLSKIMEKTYLMLK